MERCFKKPGSNCPGSVDCRKKHVSIDISSQHDGDGEVQESFCVGHWTPDQFDQLREFINRQSAEVVIQHFSAKMAQPSIPAIDDLTRISDRSVRIFHVLHSLFGPEQIKRFYRDDTIRSYRRFLRNSGFDYPPRTVTTGPRKPRVERDLAVGPSKPRRSKQAASGGAYVTV